MKNENKHDKYEVCSSPFNIQIESIGFKTVEREHNL